MSLLTHYNEACKLLVVIYLSIYQPEEEEEEEARERYTFDVRGSVRYTRVDKMVF